MHPDVVDVLALERTAVGAWLPDQLTARHGWLLRAAEGFTGRANSALALADPGRDLDDVLADVGSWYGRRDLPTLVAVPLPALADLHDRMAGRGWTVHHGGRVMVRGIASDGAAEAPSGMPVTETAVAPPAAPPGEAIQLAATASDEWLACWHHGSTVPPAGRRLLERGGDVALAAARIDDRVVAVARGAVTDGWLGVNAVETAPTHRRRGHASRLLAALATWGVAAGATRTFLQVDLANDVARTVHERAGFVEHHTYHYLQPPSA